MFHLLHLCLHFTLEFTAPLKKSKKLFVNKLFVFTKSQPKELSVLGMTGSMQLLSRKRVNG